MGILDPQLVRWALMLDFRTAEPRDQSLTDALVRQPTFVAAPAVLNAPPLVLSPSPG